MPKRREQPVEPVEKVNVKSAEIIHRDPRGVTVEVKGRLGSRIPREYTVTFDRKGNVSHGYQFVPEIGYLYPSTPFTDKDGTVRNVNTIPPTVLKAAMEAHQEAQK